MELYEYIIISKVEDDETVPEILDGPDYDFARNAQELREEIIYEGYDPKEVDILIRPFCAPY